MPFINLNYGFIVYEDKDNSKNPHRKLQDFSNNIEKVMISFDKSDRLSVHTNEVKDIATTERTILWDNTTEISFDRYISTKDFIRIKYNGTGTAPSFVTNRNIGGDATTTVSITRVNQYVARIQNIAGAAWSLVNVQVNDVIRFEKTDDVFTSPFGTTNQGKKFVVQAKGADYIDFIDNGAASVEGSVVLGADFDVALKVVSQGPVKIGDTIQVSGSTINLSNQGKFSVLDVSDDYIEIMNELGVEETITYSSGAIVAFEYLINFIHLRSDGPIEIKFGNQQEWFALNQFGIETLFIGSVETHKIQARNVGPKPVTLSIQYAMTFC